MIYMKHSELGNAHFDDVLQAEKEAQGWVKWPRTPEQKSGSVALPVESQIEAIKRKPGRPRRVAQ